jgi:hypothetical protein
VQSNPNLWFICSNKTFGNVYYDDLPVENEFQIEFHPTLPIRQATSEIQFFTQAVENIFVDPRNIDSSWANRAEF